MPVREASRRAGAIALGASLAVTVAAIVPTPLHAHLDVARRAPRTTPVERALTGGLVTLREPGSAMIRVARSYFVMGSSGDDVGAAVARCGTDPLGHRCTENTFSNELPKLVGFVESFWLDRAEVTVEAYERCVSAGACAPRTLVAGERRLGFPKLPVTLVSAHEAAAFCRFRGSRLPSEAELERAARGTAGRVYPWGDLYNSRLSNHGRFGLESVDASDGFEELAPVGSFVSGRTPDGFLDLAGNAAEWTADVYTERHGLPPEPGQTGERVVKGGHFAQGAPWLRGAARAHHDANERLPFVGVRCARSVASTRPAP